MGKTRCNCCFAEYDDSLGVCPVCGYMDGDPADEVFCLEPGTVINDRYIIGKMLGLGGFGITYKAWDTKLETTLAIKEYFPSGLVNRAPGETEVILVARKRSREFEYGKDRFLEEARNVAKFSTHRNIVNVYDFFELNNTAYIVMEFLNGKTLRDIMVENNAPLPLEQSIDIVEDVCSALTAVHKENIIHRDVSPDNIMICSGNVTKLLDFGAARFDATVENRVTVVVKPGFAPPEQYDKVNRQDGRTDEYALGATLYYMLTGTKPEESTNRKINDTVPPPNELDPTIPQNVSNAIMRAMAVEQEFRFPTVADFGAALKTDKEVRTVAQERSKKRLVRFIGIAGGAIAVIAAVLVFVILLNNQRESVELPDASLELWYIKNEDFDSKGNALERIISSFTDEYSNVSVTIKGIEASEYTDTLMSAISSGTAPDVYESTGMSDSMPLDYSTGFADELAELGDNTYYTDTGTPDTQYPSGIVVPVVYVNTTLGTLSGAADFDTIVSECNDYEGYFVVKSEALDMYAAIYGAGAADYVSDTALEEFTSRKAMAYLGDSTDYSDVQAAIPGQYALIMPGNETAVYRFGTCWSIGDLSKNDKRASLALVEYFNSELSQDYLNTGSTDDIPILKDYLDNYITIFGEMEIVEEYLAREYEKPVTDTAALLSSADSSKLNDMRDKALSGQMESIDEDAEPLEEILVAAGGAVNDE